MDNRDLKILLRLPNWLGDSVMVSPAFEILKDYFKNAEFAILGTNVSCEIYKRDARVAKIYIDDTKKQNNRILATIALAKEIGKYDIAIAFTNNFFSALLLYLTKTSIRVGYGKNCRSILLTHRVKFIKNLHQVESYANLVFSITNKNLIYKSSESNNIGHLKLISNRIKGFNKKEEKRYIGINAGAAYGSAKRWEEKYFVEVIAHFLKNDYIVVLFGSNNENSPQNIENILQEYKCSNFINLVGKTTIMQLCDYISLMDLFITNDSGPMHIAASYNIPIIAIFGPTDSKETSPWMANAILLNKNLPCAPCKKRECPLVHHNCMKLISPDEVIENSYKLLK